MKKYYYLVVGCLMIGLLSCGNSNSLEPSNSLEKSESSYNSDSLYDPADYGKIDNLDYVHYLSFEVDGIEIAKMMTIPTDTYDSLKPYFPTIPEKIGYTGEWEKLDNVYLEDEIVITIVAYYTKVR